MKLSYSHTIPGTPEEVFRYTWDLDVQRTLDPRILKYEVAGGGPLGVGSRLSIALGFGGRLFSTEKEVLVYDENAPRADTVEHPGMGLRVHCQSRYEACEEGTRVVLDYTISARHLLGNVGLALFWLIGRFKFASEVRTWFERLEKGFSSRGARAGDVAVSPQIHGMTPGGRCPYCHADAVPVEAVACATCFARHHSDCWDEHGQCASCAGTVRYTGTEETEGRERPKLRREKE